MEQEIYVNRELSWLAFNARVLQEAEDRSVPLLERLRFLGIFSNNLDEFFRVRVANVARMANLNLNYEESEKTLSAGQLLEEIAQTVAEQQRCFQHIYNNIREELKDNGIEIINEQNLKGNQGEYIRDYFLDKVLPLMVPIMMNNLNESPSLEDSTVYFAIEMERDGAHYRSAIMKLPIDEVGRFLVIPEVDNKKQVILLDDVVRYCLDDIFSIFRYDSIAAYTIKVSRDADLYLDDDIATSFIQKINDSLKRRDKGVPVRLVYDSNISSSLLSKILKIVKLRKRDHVVEGSRYHNHKDLMNFPDIGEDRDYYTSQPPIRHPKLPERESVIKRVREEDIMVHYPYQMFTHFIDFLREAAIDPKVKEIGVTVYRSAKHSRVMNALINAARNGKKVTVLIELQARFDEKLNVYWSNKLQDEGVHVINGIPGLKVHSKIALVRRKERNGIRNYAYIGTGNLHEGTARFYADDGLFTSDKRVADEIYNLFQFFKKNYLPFQYNHLLVSPFFMRDRLTDMVNREIANAKAGGEAYITLKMNSLVDKEMIDLLYLASQSGVKIDLIVRGICCLIAGVEGISDNITAISIVDKYLEHSRISLFCNGGDEELYIGSADWMPRNLNRRIEVAVPIYNANIREELKEQLSIQLSDGVKARYLDSKMSNRYASEHGDTRSQTAYYRYLKK